MDQLERSFQEEQTNLANRIRIARTAHPTLKPVGYCHHCYEDVDKEHLFCNLVCAEGHKQASIRRGQPH